MALIKCPDCKTQISDTADACPRCGCKFKWEYNEMLRLRSEVSHIERMQPPVEGVKSKTAAGPIVAMVIGFCILALGAWLTFSDRLDAILILPGLACLGLGGIMCFYGFVFHTGAADESKSSKANADKNYKESKASLPEKKRRLAQLEAKFR